MARRGSRWSAGLTCRSNAKSVPTVRPGSNRQLLASEAAHSSSGFGAEIERALTERAAFLEREGLARRQGTRLIVARNLLDTLRTRELAGAADSISARTGLPRHATQDDDSVSGIYRERITLASGRFAMIDDGMGFALVPWRPALDKHLGEHVIGACKTGRRDRLELGAEQGFGDMIADTSASNAPCRSKLEKPNLQSAKGHLSATIHIWEKGFSPSW